MKKYLVIRVFDNETYNVERAGFDNEKTAKAFAEMMQQTELCEERKYYAVTMEI